MLKKVIGLSIACIIVLTLAAGGTWSYLSDTEKSANNLIRAGVINLVTENTGGTAYTSGVTQSINITNLKPGQSITATIHLKNELATNLSSSGINISFDYSQNNAGGSMTADATAGILRVTNLQYSRNLLSSLTDNGSKGYWTVQDLKMDTTGANHQLDNLTPSLAPGGPPVDFIIQIQMSNINQVANINSFQNCGINLTVYFTLVH